MTVKEPHSLSSADCVLSKALAAVLIEGGTDTEDAVYLMFEKTYIPITDLVMGARLMYYCVSVKVSGSIGGSVKEVVLSSN